MIPAGTCQLAGSMRCVTIVILRAGVVDKLDISPETALRWLQERVQEMLLEAQARLEQQDARVAAARLPNVVTPLAQMAAPPTPRAPLIIGGAQPEEYIHVGLNQGQSVWAHADIIQASVGGNQPGGQ